MDGKEAESPGWCPETGTKFPAAARVCAIQYHVAWTLAGNFVNVTPLDQPVGPPFSGVH